MYIKIISYFICICIGFIAGCRYKDLEINELKITLEQSYSKSLDAVNQKILEQQRSFDNVLLQRDNALKQANDTISDLNSIVDGVQYRIRSKNTSSGVNASSASGTTSTTDTKCEMLLSEGLQLLREGTELLQRNAIEHDALVKAVQGS